ncbi:hypothetical protein, partial [Acidocella aminolytica]|uniref:hypothetical protein n=1 Tax=Acidocella aminolytica TaxID=33998 RepID=UPI0019D6F66C
LPQARLSNRNGYRIVVHIKANVSDKRRRDSSPMHEVRRRPIQRNPRNPAYCETDHRPISGEHLV